MQRKRKGQKLNSRFPVANHPRTSVTTRSFTRYCRGRATVIYDRLNLHSIPDPPPGRPRRTLLAGIGFGVTRLGRLGD